MATSRVTVDLLNPGQVFACMGLMEATEVLLGPCEGTFEHRIGQTQGSFAWSAAGESAPIEVVVDFLRSAHVCAVAPAGSGLAVQENGVETIEASVSTFPCRQPDTPAALPARLIHAGRALPLDHWADTSSRDNVKFWAGAGGYSGAALARDAILGMRAQSHVEEMAHTDPFEIEAAMTSSFRFDWRRDSVPMDVGFSLNSHRQKVGGMLAVGFPLVELLAAIGMQHARPTRVTPRDKLRYRYAVSTAVLPTIFARAVLGGTSLGFPVRTFTMRLDWPGKEGQARCIVDAFEESSDE